MAAAELGSGILEAIQAGITMPQAVVSPVISYPMLDILDETGKCCLVLIQLSVGIAQ